MREEGHQRFRLSVAVIRSSLLLYQMHKDMAEEPQTEDARTGQAWGPEEGWIFLLRLDSGWMDQIWLNYRSQLACVGRYWGR